QHSNESVQTRRKMIQLPGSSPARVTLRPEIGLRAVSAVFFQSIASVKSGPRPRNSRSDTRLSDELRYFKRESVQRTGKTGLRNGPLKNLPFGFARLRICFPKS